MENLLTTCELNSWNMPAALTTSGNSKTGFKHGTHNPYSGVLLSKTWRDKSNVGSNLNFGAGIGPGIEGLRTFADDEPDEEEANFEGSINR